MKFYAVVDTNVLVSALLSRNNDSATVQVVRRMIAGDVIPLYSNATMAEYREVMARKKFKFVPEAIEYILTAIEKFGILVEPNQEGIELPDPKDVPFYEIVLEKKGRFALSGNGKHKALHKGTVRRNTGRIPGDIKRGRTAVKPHTMVKSGRSCEEILPCLTETVE